MEFNKLISSVEAKYYLNRDEILKNQNNVQSSYNLPSEFFKYAKSKNILIEDASINYVRKSVDGNAFVLQSDYIFKLGQGVLWLIGEEYRNIENKFIASKNTSNGKFQLYRKVYSSFNSEEYDWFVKLYDKNICDNELVLDIDEEKKVLTLDIRFGERK